MAGSTRRHDRSVTGRKNAGHGNQLGRLRLFHFKEGETRQIAPSRSNGPNILKSFTAVAFTPDGKTLVSGGEDNS